ncbi:MAG: RDD family protein [Pseudomonadota bacterium]
MTNIMDPSFGAALNGLPNPRTQSGFYAGVPLKRAIAWVFDGFVVFLLTIAFSVLTFGLGFFVFFGAWALFSFLYRSATLTTGSATWGMRVMSIELRDGNGQRLTGGQAVLHTLGTIFSFATGLQLVSIAMMLLTERGQGLTDAVLNTTALNKAARA